MAITIYVDGCGGSDPKYGFFVKETGKSFVTKCAAGPNDKVPEYLALKSALEWLVSESAQNNDITIYTDFKTLVDQVNHESAINNDELRNIVTEMWPIIQTFSSLEIRWISRKENPAGKMLGS